MFTPPEVDRQDFHRALLTSYELTTRLTLMTAEHDAVAQVTRDLLAGQVNWLGSDSTVSRTAEVELLDPDNELDLDSDSPDDGAVYANRFLQLEQRIVSPLLPEPVLVPVFTGPLMVYRRDGDVLTVEAQSKEQRANTDHSHVVCGKGMRVVDAIERIMRSTGERRFRLPSGVKERLPKDVSVGRAEEHWPWRMVQRLANSIGMQAFYDGEGFFVVRDVPNRPIFSFERPTSLSRREHDWSQVYNRVQVKGKKKVRYTAALPPGHPFSPRRMGVNGEPWQHTFFYEDDKIANRAQAKKVAERELAKVAKQRVSVTFDHVPVWHLDPEDPCEVAGDRITFREASAPLTGDSMTVGYTAAVRRPRR